MTCTKSLKHSLTKFIANSSLFLTNYSTNLQKLAIYALGFSLL